MNVYSELLNWVPCRLPDVLVLNVYSYRRPIHNDCSSISIEAILPYHGNCIIGLVAIHGCQYGECSLNMLVYANFYAFITVYSNTNLCAYRAIKTAREISSGELQIENQI